MSRNQPSAHTSAINDDVLLCIITFNADMFADRQALHTTRIASQVCRQWRNVTLSTPSLWARLVDMDHIHKRRTDEWRNEIVQRGGAAPLWIRADTSGRMFSGPMSAHDQYIMQFFFDFVRVNFYRIQKLAVLGAFSNFNFTHSMLSLPAPQLEHLEATLQRAAGDRNKNAATAPLFANHAPMLRIFCLRHYAVDHRAPWLCHVRSMVLDRTYSVPDALAILSASQCLEELQIKDIYTGNIPTSLPIFSLSHLKSLEYYGSSKPASMLLDHVVIPAGCSLIILIHRFDNRESITEEKSHLLSVISIFARHAERSLQSNVFKSIVLNYAREDYISLTSKTALPVERFLGISIPLYGDSDANLLETFLKKSTQLDLTSVTNLSFTADHRLNPYFGTFFSRLSSVEIISNDLGTLSHLAHLQKKYIHNATKKPGILFPLLKVVNLSIRPYSSQNITFVNDVASAFLLWRLREGHPVTVLDMSKHLPLYSPPRLNTLAEVKGLKVRYKLSAVEGIVEYTCGSDDPEKCIDTN